MTESQPFWIAVYDNDGKVVLFRRVESPSARGALTQLTEQMSAGNADYGAWTSGTSPIWLETMPVQPRICGARTWPYTEHNVCVLPPHQAGDHLDDRDRPFDHTGYHRGEVKP
jgi:hypothetical protein